MRLLDATPIPIAQAAANMTPPGLLSGLVVYGPLGLWVIYMICRDYWESKKREKELELAHQRHMENLEAMRKMEDAMRSITDSFIIGVAGLKQMDSNFQGLLEKVKAQNHPS